MSYCRHGYLDDANAGIDVGEATVVEVDVGAIRRYGHDGICNVYPKAPHGVEKHVEYVGHKE